ncbi:MAG: N-6 DNA methylase [Oscillospiraceae bacterium]|nr:N-6 DNA methylase [Oscillospiraceae bacterium]
MKKLLREPGEKLTKSRDRVKKHGEVFTPKKVVGMMCDMLEANDPGAWSDISKAVLEPSCGNGNFLEEITRRRLAACDTPESGVKALRNIYGIDILPDNVDDSRKRMLDIFQERFGDIMMLPAAAIIEHNIVCADALKLMKILQDAVDWDDGIRRYNDK